MRRVLELIKTVAVAYANTTVSHVRLKIALLVLTVGSTWLIIHQR